MLLDFSVSQTLIVCLLFVWAGFVRTGLGFGGAALGLPLMLFLNHDPLLWLPIIGTHLLFFSGLTLSQRLHNVDWAYLRHSAVYIIPPAIIGVFGLVSLPTLWLNVFIYSVSLFYGIIWMLNRSIESHGGWVDKLLLMLGGYVAGTSLTGAPLMVAVYMRHVAKEKLRDTLFVLWFVLVSLKMTTFLALSVEMHFITALWLIPVAAIGHVLGLKTHAAITRNDITFKRWIGGGLAIVSTLGLLDLVY
ncbi:TSUP family transporter [Thiothrix lacustris]|uniref:Probable membrane transporter protein n=1 Tax=Thiothrix lacustris TaxID=525917 RepID=A0ABY9MS19_9GAMM|nr:TSUP family transporter [Thiothrix lacustris]WML90990.1 TSUP family transporter [Thiothrix lacustris]WMP17109.1 TSUP family transporter [Thiothrix lacustris]